MRRYLVVVGFIVALPSVVPAVAFYGVRVIPLVPTSTSSTAVRSPSSSIPTFATPAPTRRLFVTD